MFCCRFGQFDDYKLPGSWSRKERVALGFMEQGITEIREAFWPKLIGLQPTFLLYRFPVPRISVVNVIFVCNNPCNVI
jgi:hypothetical protein